MEIFLWLGSKILSIFDSRTKIRVLVHEASFIGSSNENPYYFVKVINSSRETIVTIQHIWIKDYLQEIEVLNTQKPLPHKLDKSDIFETWFPKSSIKDQQKVFNNVHVVLSNGKTYRSTFNKDVRPAGHVA